MNPAWRGTVAALSLSMAGLFQGAAAQEVTLKVHHFGSPKSPQHVQMLVPWCEKVAKDSAGRIRCDVFPAMQLGGAPAQLYDQAKNGIVDIVWTIPGYSAGRFPLMEVFELPFMMSNPEATSKAAWEFAATHAAAEFKDTHLLAVHVNGPCNVYTIKQPVRTLEDFKGLKLRAPNRQTSKMLAALGATPVGMPVPAVPEALSKGVIDGTVVPYEIAPSIKLDELTHHVAETDRSHAALCSTIFAMTMNTARYNALPPDLRKVIDQNSGLAMSGQLGRIQGDADVPGKQRMTAAGARLQPIGTAELARWRPLMVPIEDQWVSEVSAKGADGRRLLQAARDLVAQHSR